ncbi:MAG TPA: type IX secretion system outer membrane channel protein PorV [Bacteroidales bacterium]|nr:type IX secretion system outer membrane channel protein PorV [Bacteroidales bacterium]HPS16964.1 type IX secretion system outer membrane channel protein PorV [Bacteroidales bacterium]
MKKVFLYPTIILNIGLFLISISVISQNSSTSNVFQYSNKDLNTITTAVPFLMIAPDARAGALGDAGVASTPDANSLHWNPAKYAFIEKNMGFSVSYSPWLRALVNDINLAYLTGYKKFGKDQAIAASLLYFSLGDITFTDINGTNIGQFRPSEYAFDVCYARKFSEVISGSVALRYIHSNLTGGNFVGGAESHPGNSIATDISAFYQKDLEFGKTPAKLGVGINISNIGQKISYTETTERDFIPMNLRIGPSLTVDIDEYNQIAFLLDINKLLVPTTPVYETDSNGLPVTDAYGNNIILAGKDPNVSVVSGLFQSFGDAPGGFKEEIREFTISTGVEYWYDKQFAIRGGLFYEDKTKGNRKYFTLGAGLKYNVFGLDFAYLIPIEQRNPLENTLRFTLLFDFDAFKEQNKTE